MLQQLVFPSIEPGRVWITSIKGRTLRDGVSQPTTGSKTENDQDGTADTASHVVGTVDFPNNMAVLDWMICPDGSIARAACTSSSSQVEFLCADKTTGLVSTTVDPPTGSKCFVHLIQQSSLTSKDTNPSGHFKVFIAPKNKSGVVYCRVDGSIYLRPGMTSASSHSAQWTIHPQYGELLFLSHSKTDQRLRCDLLGNLNMESNWKGWEVFRFSEVGDGSVRISSWAHASRVVCATEKGIQTQDSSKLPLLYDSPEAVSRDQQARWVVEKMNTKSSLEGVILRNVFFGSYLAFHENKGLHTTTKATSSDAVWQVETANRNRFELISHLSASEVKTLITITSQALKSPSLSESIKCGFPGQVWKFYHNPGSSAFYIGIDRGPLKQRQYLSRRKASRADEKTVDIVLVEPPTAPTVWYLHRHDSSDNGFLISTTPDGGILLSRKADESVVIAPHLSPDVVSQVWTVKPYMPLTTDDIIPMWGEAIVNFVTTPFRMLGVSEWKRAFPERNNHMGVQAEGRFKMVHLADETKEGPRDMQQTLESLGAIGAGLPLDTSKVDCATLLGIKDDSSRTKEVKASPGTVHNGFHRPFAGWRFW